MSGGPVTTNPVLICLINMTIVFGILAILGCLIELIHKLDPTKVKEEPQQAAPVAAVQETAVAAEPAGTSMEDKTLVAVITTALMAYGYADVRVTSIKKV